MLDNASRNDLFIAFCDSDGDENELEICYSSAKVDGSLYFKASLHKIITIVVW